MEEHKRYMASATYAYKRAAFLATVVLLKEQHGEIDLKMLMEATGLGKRACCKNMKKLGIKGV